MYESGYGKKTMCDQKAQNITTYYMYYHLLFPCPFHTECGSIPMSHSATENCHRVQRNSRRRENTLLTHIQNWIGGLGLFVCVCVCVCGSPVTVKIGKHQQNRPQCVKAEKRSKSWSFQRSHLNVKFFWRQKTHQLFPWHTGQTHENHLQHDLFQTHTNSELRNTEFWNQIRTDISFILTILVAPWLWTCGFFLTFQCFGGSGGFEESLPTSAVFLSFLSGDQFTQINVTLWVRISPQWLS